VDLSAPAGKAAASGRIQQAENRQSQRVYRQKHDAQTR